MNAKEIDNMACISKGYAGLGDKAGIKNLPLRLKGRESNALVYKRVAPFAPNNRINQPAKGKLILWHNESNRYGLCWDAGVELNAQTIRRIIEDSFTEYNVPLVIKTAHDNIFTIKKADDGDRARGIIVLANPVRYALFLGKIEWHLEEMLEQVRSAEPERMGIPAEKPTSMYQSRDGVSACNQNLLAGMIGLEQELVENLRPQNEGENIRRQARRLAIDMTLLMEMVCDCANEVKNTDDAGTRRLADRIQRWAM